MAFGTDFYVDIFLCRSCYECVSTVAGYSCLIVVRMDSFTHDFHLSMFVLFSIRINLLNNYEFTISQLSDYNTVNIELQAIYKNFCFLAI